MLGLSVKIIAIVVVLSGIVYIFMPSSTAKATDIFDAIEKADIRYINKYIHNKEDLYKTNYLGRTLLVHTVIYPGITAAHAKQILAIFLDAGCDIDQRAIDGATPLLMAIKSENHELAMYLLDRGANPNIEDSEGNTPLTCYHNNKQAVELVKKLLSHNANITHKNNVGIDAISLAKLYKRQDLLDILNTKK